MNLAASCDAVRAQRRFTRARREISGGYEAERQDVRMKTPNGGDVCGGAECHVEPRDPRPVLNYPPEKKSH